MAPAVVRLTAIIGCGLISQAACLLDESSEAADCTTGFLQSGLHLQVTVQREVKEVTPARAGVGLPLQNANCSGRPPADDLLPPLSFLAEERVLQEFGLAAWRERCPAPLDKASLVSLGIESHRIADVAQKNQWALWIALGWLALALSLIVWSFALVAIVPAKEKDRRLLKEPLADQERAYEVGVSRWIGRGPRKSWSVRLDQVKEHGGDIEKVSLAKVIFKSLGAKTMSAMWFTAFMEEFLNGIGMVYALNKFLTTLENLEELQKASPGIHLSYLEPTIQCVILIWGVPFVYRIFSISVVLMDGHISNFATSGLASMVFQKVESMMQLPQDPDLFGTGQQPALMIASGKGHIDVVRLLLEAGGDTNLPDSDGFTALMIAAYKGPVEVVSLLLEAGADLNLANNNCRTALMVAAHHSRVEVVRLLLEAGADINLANNKGSTALVIAAYRGPVEVVRLLLEAGADLNLSNNSGSTALMLAADYGHVEVVRVLLEAGADVNLSNNSGSTALMLAADYGHVEVVRVLLEAGADVNLANNGGWTALMVAARKGRVEIVRVLLEAGADLNLANSSGSTAWMLTAQQGDVEFVRLLLEAGSDVNLANNGGWTALMVAARKGRVDVVRLLLEARADVNLANNNGGSKAHADAAHLLFDSGADKNLADQAMS
ncbi:Ankyrin repeat domain-containing protein 17 [Symbiodinium microadriaticum]|uniref:Ankyrin repeat domain-containing protein 17 n=1 Tax=Symbiodinium microadriaticum TaxID=2951 RepID=A0A1Q9CCU0_SYMMI|nr:Ankyrin repeat domain-containing protein 17 [Symbiodinium microadriaticum]